MTLACVGDVTIDTYVDLDRRLLGGCSLNQAAHLAALGHRVRLISRVGREDAAWIDARLEALGVENGCVPVSGETARCGIQVDEEGERTFPFFDAGVLEGFHLSAEERTFLKQADAILIGLSSGLENAFEDVLETETTGLRAADFSEDYGAGDGLPFDILRDALPRLAIAFVGATRSDPTPLAELTRPDVLIVATRGPEGSIAWEGDRVVRETALKVPVVDTTGAGDAFQAAFLSAHLKGAPLREALKAGHKRAARVIQHLGALKNMQC